METEKAYWSEFTRLVTIAVAFTFFVVSFKYFGKLVVGKLPAPGLQEALTA